MPDISLCKNITCPLKEDCYRFKAKPGIYQSYVKFEPVKKGKNIVCKHFIKLVK